MFLRRISKAPSQFLHIISGQKISFVAPVEIRAASSCIFSSSCLSFWVQLSHMISAYSITGRMNEMYIFSNDFLSSKNLSFLIMFILAQAFFLYSLHDDAKNSPLKVQYLNVYVYLIHLFLD